MDRDRRLTGMLRGQTDKPEAPAGFELNNPWRVCTPDGYISLSSHTDNVYLAREPHHLDSVCPRLQPHTVHKSYNEIAMAKVSKQTNRCEAFVSTVTTQLHILEAPRLRLNMEKL